VSVRRLDPVQPESFTFSAENLAWAKKVVGNYPQGKQASAVIPVLWRAQEQIGGWVTRPAIEAVARLLDMAYIRVLEVATFYTMFQLSPVGRKAHIQVCGTTPCMLRGAEELKEVCRTRIHTDPHHLSAEGDFSWEEAECLGACVNAPMVQIGKDTYEDLTPAIFAKLIDDIATSRQIKPGPQIKRQLSAPEGELTTLTDPSLYSRDRKFTRQEPPPVTPPADAPETAKAGEVKAATGTPVPAAVKEPAKAAADDRTKVVKPAAEAKSVEITNPKAPKPIKLSEQKVQPARKPQSRATKPLANKPKKK